MPLAGSGDASGVEGVAILSNQPVTLEKPEHYPFSFRIPDKSVLIAPAVRSDVGMIEVEISHLHSSQSVHCALFVHFKAQSSPLCVFYAIIHG